MPQPTNVPTAPSFNGSRLLSQDELGVQAQTGRSASAPPVKVSRSEKEVLLSFFIAHELHVKTESQCEVLFMDATKELSKHECCRVRSEHLISERYIANYYLYNASAFNNDAKAAPYERDIDTGTLLKEKYGKPYLEDDILNR